MVIRSIFKRGEVVFPIAAVITLWSLVAYVYSDALKLIPLSDQVCYLVETIFDRGFLESVFRTFDFNRSGVVNPGDVAAFRPGGYVVLSFEKWAFGTSFALWQAVGIILHCIVTLQVFCIVRRLYLWATGWCDSRNDPAEVARVFSGPWSHATASTIVAFVTTMFFALNIGASSLVTWAHIHFYMIFYAFLLGAFGSLLRVLSRPEMGVRGRRGWLGVAWFCLLCSTFFVELGFFTALIVGTVLAGNEIRRKQWRSAVIVFCAFASIMVIYQAVNIIDFRLRSTQIEPDLTYGMILGKAFSLSSLINAARFVAFSMVQPFFPAHILYQTSDYLLGARISLMEPTWSSLRFDAGSIISILAIGGSAALGFLGLKRLLKHRPVNYGSFITVLFVVLAVYVGLNVLGRMNMQPYAGLLPSNSHYCYLPIIMLSIGLGCVLPFVIYEYAGKIAGRVLVAAFLMALFITGLSNAAKTRAATSDFAVTMTPLRTMCDSINSFIALHENERKFSIAFDIEKLGTPVALGVPITTTLYHRFENNYDPLYVLTKDETGVKWVSGPGFAPDSIPKPYFFDIVEVGHWHHIYRYRGKYVVALYSIWGVNKLAAEARTLEDARMAAKKLLENADKKYGPR